MKTEKFLDLVARWNIIDHEYICDCMYNSFMQELGYKANVIGDIDTNFADGLIMFIEWAKDKEFILRPYANNGTIVFETLDKILKYCCVVDQPVLHGTVYEKVMFTKEVYLLSLGGTKMELHGLAVPYNICVDMTVEKFYNLVNQASLNSHGISIKEMQERIDFEELKEYYIREEEHYGENGKFPKIDCKFSNGKHVYYTSGRQSVSRNPFLSSSSSSPSSSGILDMGRKNLGNSGVGFVDYYGE